MTMTVNSSETASGVVAAAGTVVAPVGSAVGPAGLEEPDGGAAAVPGNDAGPASTTTPPRRWALARAPWRSPAGQPRWARPGLLAIAAMAATLYAWGINASPLHSYYAPAIKSMATSWKAFIYGAFDPAASITLDKLPLAFQIDALSVRLFGYSNWAVILPQVIESVITVLALYALVRRWRGPAAGLIAAGAFAATPIVAALARAEIADTALTMFLVLAALAWQRAVTGGRLRWLLLCGGLVGLAFHAKMVEAWAVLPAFAVGYLIAAPGGLRRRLGHLGVAGLVTLAASSLWIALILLTPAANRPYVDGTTDNNPLAMIFEYNLSSRYGVSSDQTVNFGAGGGPVGGEHINWWYIFGSDIASQVGWLYPLALLGLVLGLARLRRPRTDLVRAGTLMWGLWLLAFAAGFSAGRVAHSFYVVALAPPLAALAAGGLVSGWSAYRRGGWQRWLLPIAVAATVAWSWWLLRDFPTFLPWLRPVVLVAGTAAALALVGAAVGGGARGSSALRRVTAGLATGGVAATLAAVLLAPAAWAASTLDATYAGSAIGPTAGPANGMGGGRGGPGAPRSVFAGGPAGGQLQAPPGQSGGSDDANAPRVRAGDDSSSGDGSAAGAVRQAGAGPGGGPGGTEPNSQVTDLVKYLRAHNTGQLYDLAVSGSQQAGQYILAGASVLPMGGFSGQVPFPTQSQLAKLVAQGKLRYVLVGGSGREGSTTSSVSEWVTSHCTAVTDSAVSSTDGSLYQCQAS